MSLAFERLAHDGAARRGRLRLAHGEVETPAFMPVGTYGTVKAMTPRELEELGAQIVLGNTFHLWLRPGLEVIGRHGGLHRFMGWQRPILTDSGGFQVFSLGRLRRIGEEGVRFASPVNGDRLLLTPEESMRIQGVLDSDVAMVFDECTPYEVDGAPATRAHAADSMRLSLRWAARCRDEFDRLGNRNALFGIVQGGMYEERVAGRPGRDRLRRLRHRRAVGGRTEGGDAARAGPRRPAPAGGPAALPDGRRHAGGPARRHRRRDRHVRLRAADAQRAQRLAVHLDRRRQDPQQPAPPTPAATSAAATCTTCSGSTRSSGHV